MMRISICWTFLLAACMGCDPAPDSTVEGAVTIDGELANRGTVVFHPVEGGAPAYGNIFENGTYSLRVGQGEMGEVDGGEVAAGEYIVTVVVNGPSTASEAPVGGPPMPGPRLTADKYAKKETSDLRVTVKRGVNVIPLELEGATEPNMEASEDDQAGAADNPAEVGAETTDPPAEGEAEEAASGVEGETSQGQAEPSDILGEEVTAADGGETGDVAPPGINPNADSTTNSEEAQP